MHWGLQIYKVTKIKIFIWQKMEKELETFTPTIRIYSQDKGMGFGIEKCAILKMEKEMRETRERIELQSKKAWERLEKKKITSI